jgi:hypothetical protein
MKRSMISAYKNGEMPSIDTVKEGVVLQGYFSLTLLLLFSSHLVPSVGYIPLTRMFSWALATVSLASLRNL